MILFEMFGQHTSAPKVETNDLTRVWLIMARSRFARSHIRLNQADGRKRLGDAGVPPCLRGTVGSIGDVFGVEFIKSAMSAIFVRLDRVAQSPPDFFEFLRRIPVDVHPFSLRALKLPNISFLDPGDT